MPAHTYLKTRKIPTSISITNPVRGNFVGSNKAAFIWAWKTPVASAVDTAHACKSNQFTKGFALAAASVLVSLLLQQVQHLLNLLPATSAFAEKAIRSFTLQLLVSDSSLSQ